MALTSKVKLLAGAGLTLAIGIGLPAAAQDPVLEDISKNSFNVIRHLSKINEPEMSLASAEKIKRAVMADDALDAGETQMLQYLISGQSFSIRVPSSTDDASYSKPLSAEAKVFLQALGAPKADAPVDAIAAPAISAKEQEGLALLKAAERGDAQAQYAMAKFHGDTREMDYYSVDKRVYWLQKAAAQSHAEAQYDLASAYSYGRHFDGSGVDRSLKTAMDLYKRAAEQGDTDAMVQIGHFYRGGDGVEKSSKTAFNWYEKAAKLDNPRGMYFLAIRYLEGDGAAQSDAKAKAWLKKSYALGNEDAEDELWERWGIE